MFLYWSVSDGLHLTPEGNAVVHKEVVKTLRNAGLRAEDMSYDFPHHSKIDGSCPDMAFKWSNFMLCMFGVCTASFLHSRWWFRLCKAKWTKASGRCWDSSRNFFCVRNSELLLIVTSIRFGKQFGCDWLLGLTQARLGATLGLLKPGYGSAHLLYLYGCYVKLGKMCTYLIFLPSSNDVIYFFTKIIHIFLLLP